MKKILVLSIVAALLSSCSGKNAPAPEEGIFSASAGGVSYYRLGWEGLVPLGMQNGLSSLNKFGRNTDADTGAPEDVWAGGGLYQWPDSAQVIQVVSDSTTDDTGGTGALTLRIYGLDSVWNAASEDVTMNGDTAVLTNASFIRVHRAEILTAGANGVNNGEITLTYQDDTNTAAVIAAGRGRSSMAIYTTPAGYYGLITEIQATCNRAAAGGTASIGLYQRQSPDLSAPAWVATYSGIINSDGASSVVEKPAPFILLRPKTDVRLVVQSVSNDNTDVAGGFSLVLVDSTKARLLTQY